MSLLISCRDTEANFNNTNWPSDAFWKKFVECFETVSQEETNYRSRFVDCLFKSGAFGGQSINDLKKANASLNGLLISSKFKLDPVVRSLITKEFRSPSKDTYIWHGEFKFTPTNIGRLVQEFNTNPEYFQSMVTNAAQNKASNIAEFKEKIKKKPSGTAGAGPSRSGRGLRKRWPRQQSSSEEESSEEEPNANASNGAGPSGTAGTRTGRGVRGGRGQPGLGAESEEEESEEESEQAEPVAEQPRAPRRYLTDNYGNRVSGPVTKTPIFLNDENPCLENTDDTIHTRPEENMLTIFERTFRIFENGFHVGWQTASGEYNILDELSPRGDINKIAQEVALNLQTKLFELNPNVFVYDKVGGVPLKYDTAAVCVAAFGHRSSFQFSGKVKQDVLDCSVIYNFEVVRNAPRNTKLNIILTGKTETEAPRPGHRLNESKDLVERKVGSLKLLQKFSLDELSERYPLGEEMFPRLKIVLDQRLSDFDDVRGEASEGEKRGRDADRVDEGNDGANKPAKQCNHLNQELSVGGNFPGEFQGGAVRSEYFKSRMDLASGKDVSDNLAFNIEMLFVSSEGVRTNIPIEEMENYFMKYSKMVGHTLCVEFDTSFFTTSNEGNGDGYITKTYPREVPLESGSISVFVTMKKNETPPEWYLECLFEDRDNTSPTRAYSFDKVDFDEVLGSIDLVPFDSQEKELQNALRPMP